MLSKPHWVVRLLYNNNPFYLISGLLILFALHSSSTAVVPDQAASIFAQNLALAGLMTGYAALMALTGVLVIRLAKVWEDARTIYLIVILALLGMSVVFDQLCVQDLNLAGIVLGAGLLFSIAIIEITLHASGLKLPVNFRLPCYLVFAVFFGTPLLLGSEIVWVEQLGDLKVAVFPTLAGMAFLTLLTAVRCGRVHSESNGSPWVWPYFPWSLFVVLFIAVVFRANALAISFGPTTETSLFLNPLFYAPLLFVGLILLMEIAVVENIAGLRMGVLVLSPVVLCLGPLSKIMPYQENLVRVIEQAIAPTTVLVGWGLAALMLYFYRRGVAGARIAMCLTIALLSVPTASAACLKGMPIAIPLICSLPFLVELSCALVKRNSVGEWVSTSCFFGILIGSIAYSFVPDGAVVLGVAAWAAATLTVGLFFETELMKVMRGLVAFTFGFAMMMLARNAVFNQAEFVSTMILTWGITLVSVVYWRMTQRTGWRKLAIWNGVFAVLSVAALFKNELSPMNISGSAWPIIAGLFFFGVGISITCLKAGVVEKIWTLCRYRSEKQFLPGF